ncbi:hypothetical protein POVWA2_040790 [Plasmodium ovale wallikeri]|uniref:Uncharacterized protein n=1 Tax=Plasmodium ovale wallikeri TaxID=864142 RepID=A0A1A8Z9D9_PLAOA|nr:hypothetical protein POVWA1_042280 [Plasmodium ovale wallikeri]SBT40937.1 hypothetical protein POVWA2_040790 [Plasmodium ovale wallikeri]
MYLHAYGRIAQTERLLKCDPNLLQEEAFLNLCNFASCATACIHINICMYASGICRYLLVLVCACCCGTTMASQQNSDSRKRNVQAVVRSDELARK